MNVNKTSSDTAMVVEMVGGWFGFLGLGYLLTGNIFAGIVSLVGWWIVLVITWSTVGALSALIVGVCLIPFQIAVHLGVPVLSGIVLKAQLERRDNK